MYTIYRLQEEQMDRKGTAIPTPSKKEHVALDPGNLMLSIYTLAIGLIILFSGLLPAG